jgi:hypothetical protein
MLVIEQHILNRNIQKLPLTEVNLTNPYEEINRVTRKLTSLLLDLDKD